jgi:transposase
MRADYSKGLIKQVEELTVQNERIREENKSLRTENRELRVRINNLETTMESRIEAAIAAAVQKATAPLLSELAEKEEKIVKLETEVARLKAQINKDSSNSSKPPSQDGFKKVSNSREKSVRKSGGQSGHRGSYMKLPENLDELVEKGLARVDIADHTGGADNYVTRHTVDIDVVIVVTEHRYAAGSVPTVHRAPVVYGNKIKTLVCLLSVVGFIAMERLSDFIREITYNAINLSDATIEKFMTDFSDKLGGELAVIETDLLNGYTMSVDDTPIDAAEKPDYSGDVTIMRKSEHSSFTAYIRTHSNEQSTLYTVNPQKDAQGCERDGILPQYMGILSHDHEAKFYKYGSGHATCGSHLLRELKGLFVLQKIPWADEMRQFISNINSYKNDDLAAGRSECLPKSLAFFEKTYDSLLSDGLVALAALKENEMGYQELRRMLNRLTEYKDCYLLFIRDYRVPFTNNLAERDLRPDKTKQKVSGCFRSWDGLQTFARIRSFLSTVKKRSGNLFNSISSVLDSTPVLQ